MLRNMAVPSCCGLSLAAALVLGACDGEVGTDAGVGADSGSADSDSPDSGSSDSANIGAWMRARTTVVASARAEVREGGARPCEDDGPSCLMEACEYPLGCIYVADMTYVSTPAEGTEGPPLTIHAQYFQTAVEGERAGDAPVAVLNHGGREVGAATVAFALELAVRGYGVLVSTYRGSGGADGAVEGCLGEADDVRILSELVRTGVPDAAMAMLGGSHGGCVTLQAIADGAPVDASVALWPGTDGARRFRYNLASAAAGSPLTQARDRCAGDGSSCCVQVRSEHAFVTEELAAGTEEQVGPLPNWETTAYTCDDPAFAPTEDPWVGSSELEEVLCSRSPLWRAASLTYDAPLLVVAGERDPYIHYEESCLYARQAGSFALRRLNDAGDWEAASATSPCEGLALEGGEPGTWGGDRHLILVEPLGHGDSGRVSASDACDPGEVASPDVNALVFAFLEEKLGL